MEEYILEFEDYQNLSVSQFITKIKSTEGKPLKDLKIRDLSFKGNDHLEGGHGVYFFKHNQSIVLVGKARSNSFTERIGKHFDVRPQAWFNRLLFVTNRAKFFEEDANVGFKLASKHAFKFYSLVLVNMKNTDQIDQFERILRGTADCLNAYKNKTHNADLILRDL